MSKIYQYFVEGECEEKLINALKIRPQEYLTPGKVTVFNFTNKLITNPCIAVVNKEILGPNYRQIILDLINVFKIKKIRQNQNQKIKY